MAGFWKLTKRLNSNNIGVVTGSDFRNGSLPNAYLGRKEEGKFLGIFQKYSSTQLLIYGEKIEDYVFGKEDTLVTIQIDQMLAERFGMEYVDSDGTKKNPYIIHRTSIGCYERTLALLIEKYAGAFPLWLAPEQVRILPVSEKFSGYAKQVEEKLKLNGFRAETDTRPEKIGYKIREAQLEKIPYMLIVGEKEEAANEVSVRQRGQGDIGATKLDEFIGKALSQVATKEIW